MKKYLLTILLISLTNLLFAQWTTPSTGIIATTNLVGIGTPEVQTALDVQLNQSKTSIGLWGAFQLKTNESLSSNSFKLSYYFSGASTLANRAFILQTSDHNIANGGNIALQTMGGNVGIGTTTPQALLDVGKTLNSGDLASVLARLPEGNTTGRGTYLGVKGYDTQVSQAFPNVNDVKSFAIEHSFYGVTNSSINFLRGGGTG